MNSLSAPGYCAGWHSRGYKAILSDLDPSCGLHRVALVSKLPIKPVLMKLGGGSARVAAGLTELSTSQGLVPVLVLALYGFPGSTNHLVQEVVAACKSFGGMFLIVGDYNCTQEEGTVCGLLQQGAVRSFDEAGVNLPATNPLRTRRIDYGLGHHLLWAHEILHFEQSFSDHSLVAYRINAETMRSVFFPPRVQPLPENGKDNVAAKFAQAWRGQGFEQALAQEDTNLAWTMLSDAAELALATGEEAAGHRRSLAWEPQKCEQQSHKPSCNGHESDSLRLLRRISAQLRRLRVQPHVGGLRLSLSKGFAKLRRIFSDLPFISLDDLDPVIEWIERLTEDLSAQEKEAVIHVWRERTVSNPVMASSWVKRKAQEALTAEAPKEDIHKHQGPVHPASLLRQQAEVWSKHWTTAGQRLDYDRIQNALGCLPDVPALQHMPSQLSVHALIAAASQMKGKAPGPDRWAAEHFLLLPQEWWQAFLNLWQHILGSGNIPLGWKKVMIALVRKPTGGTRPLGLCQIAWRIGARAINKCLRAWVLSWAGLVL